MRPCFVTYRLSGLRNSVAGGLAMDILLFAFCYLMYNSKNVKSKYTFEVLAVSLRIKSRMKMQQQQKSDAT